ncbi:HD-GYP domain-containing protein [Aquibacillus koreensis]|uniref:HD-GYP domain-containing protein n=1 Tax=Aquibacillus koreensis TaxID=279446 RepID=A0A9X3WI35_9BACI|nr:HD-GYP domain-containing protein [Aquibacillus koreensis]MCT2535916.1 HD-GYP domain-containing protein [Aquibacillus koreensis]MDC3420372.1 HD-GYP domain-containing protein [Aquibacillus koreensis]
MRLVATKTIRDGSELAKTIYNDNGQVLIQRDIKLTKRMLKRLQDLGITYVYIKDAFTEDIIIDPPIPEELRIEAVQMVRTSFDEIRKQGFNRNAYLFEKTSAKMADMVGNIVNEVSNRDEVISIMSDILISDDYIFSHSINVTIYALAIASELNYSPKKIEHIGLGAMLHDVGKVFIPEPILNKAGRLTNHEFDIIKTHSEEGFNFLRKASTVPLLVAHCAYQHHERLDGSGYPRGIMENDIHPYGKLLAVADVFDAVTSNRVYRDAMLPHEGLEILYSGSGTLFDRGMVEAFRKTIAVYPNGIEVELSDGREGIVVKQNKNLYERPVIRIIREFGQDVKPYDIDLAKVLNVMIVNCDLGVVNKV